MKRTYLLIAFCFFSIYISAQITIGKSAGQQITENAINGSIVIVRQSYQVKEKKSDKLFGLDGRNAFGNCYSIGVKTEAGLVVDNRAIEPWKYDEAFKKLEKEYEPVISLTEIREMEVGDSVKYQQCPLRLGRKQPNGLWIADTGTVQPHDMEIDTEDGEKDGWMVWFVANKNLDNDSLSSVAIQTINKKVKVSRDSIDIAVDSPSVGDLLLSGIYVCPYFTGGGHVSYRLVGMMVMLDDKWVLRTPFVGMAVNRPSSRDGKGKAVANDDDNKGTGLQLTPISKEKPKGKKNVKGKNAKK